MSILAIVNPVSGRRTLGERLRRVVRLVCDAGCPITVRLTRQAGEAADLAGDAPEDTRAILVVGGDGTVREVIDGLLTAGRSLPIAIMPNGTENLVARELNQPTDPVGVARTLLGGRPTPCDVGQVNDRHFLFVTGAGFDAEVVERLTSARLGHITHWDYFWPVWRTFWTHKFPRLRVTADGEEVFEGCGLVLVGVMARYPAGLRVLNRARSDDGMLDVCAVPCQSRPKLLRHALNVLRQVHDRTGGMVYRKCLRARVEGDNGVPLEIDGDAGGRLPADFAVLPAAATVLVPPVAADLF